MTMKPDEAAKVLRQHLQWRVNFARGDESLDAALDAAVAALEAVAGVVTTRGSADETVACISPITVLQTTQSKIITLPASRYRVSTDAVEHGCCWDAAIIRDAHTDDDDLLGIGYVRVLECNKSDAEMICYALNRYAQNVENNDAEDDGS